MWLFLTWWQEWSLSPTYSTTNMGLFFWKRQQCTIGKKWFRYNASTDSVMQPKIDFFTWKRPFSGAHGLGLCMIGQELMCSERKPWKMFLRTANYSSEGLWVHTMQAENALMKHQKAIPFTKLPYPCVLVQKSCMKSKHERIRHGGLGPARSSYRPKFAIPRIRSGPNVLNFHFRFGENKTLKRLWRCLGTTVLVLLSLRYSRKICQVHQLKCKLEKIK